MKQKFEPRKIRDFGEIINDTFTFIFQTWKPLLRTYVTICGFFVAASMLTSILQQFRMMKGIRNGLAGVSRDPAGILANFFGFEYILALLFSMLTYTAISLSTLVFIHLYKEKENMVPTTEEVWTYVKFHFFRFFGSGLLVGALATIGFILCIVPGLYLWPILSLIFPIMLMENSGLGFAFSKSFTLIKGNWWSIFGVHAIMFILVIAATFVFYIPMAIAGAGSFFLGVSNMNTFGAVTQVIISHLTLVFLIFPNIALALCYYSLSEQKDGTGLIDRIKNFGTKDAVNPDLAPEEY